MPLGYLILNNHASGGKNTVNFGLNNYTDNKSPRVHARIGLGMHHLPCKRFFYLQYFDIIINNGKIQVKSVNHDTVISCETGPTPGDMPSRVRRVSLNSNL